MLDELQRKRGDRVLHIVCGEAGRLPFSTGLFNAIVFARVLDLIAKEVRRRCLPQFTQWCHRVFDVDESMPIPRELQWTILRKRT